jgi:uncharacterized membrane protein
MNIFTVLLILHIIAGSISVLIGTFIVLTKKGDKRHKLFGNIYYFSLLITAIFALPMSYLHSNIFLFIIGVFTSYMILTGKRYLQIKKIEDVKKFDWVLSIVMILFGATFLVIGSKSIINGNTFGIVVLVFGMISVLFVYQDYVNYRGKSKVKNYWLTTHLQRMVGSFIASTTAFLVVNNTFLPGLVAWLLPTILLVPLIIVWSRKYQIYQPTNRLL